MFMNSLGWRDDLGHLPFILQRRITSWGILGQKPEHHLDHVGGSHSHGMLVPIGA